MQPFFSVTISLYNKENFIVDTLKSVLNQTYTNFEIVIVNDGSTDDSLQIINQFEDSRITIINQENSGASNARNSGIKRAKADYIALLDADDIWDTNYLSTIAMAIEKYPNEHVFATAIAHKIQNKTVPANYNNLTSNRVSVLDFFKHSLKQSLLSGSSVVFKKQILEKTGWFDIDIKSGQDTDLWIRFGLHYPIVFINQVLVYYIYNRNSLSNTTFNMAYKSKYEKYIDLEKKNDSLKKYIDINRYSLAIKSKIHDQNISYQFYRNNLDIKNLPLTKKILLISPKWLLLMLLKLKSFKKEKLYYKPL